MDISVVRLEVNSRATWVEKARPIVVSFVDGLLHGVQYDLQQSFHGLHFDTKLVSILGVPNANSRVDLIIG